MLKLMIIFLIITNTLLANVAIVKTLTGTVEIQRANKTIIIKKGSLLKNADTIFTKAKSSIGIIFDDGTILSLGEKAILVINAFKVDPVKKEYDVDLDLKQGKAMFNSGKIGKLSPKSVKFRIPQGIVGIRGTKFVVEAQ